MAICEDKWIVKQFNFLSSEDVLMTVLSASVGDFLRGKWDGCRGKYQRVS